MSNLFNFEYKTNTLILITGASSGIGFSIANYLASIGMNTLAGVRKKQDFEKIIEIKNSFLKPVILDISSEDNIDKVKNEIEEYIKVNEIISFVLINNAGIVKAGPLEYLPVLEFQNQLNINVSYQLLVTQKFLPILRKVKSGKIIFTGSNSGFFSAPLVGAYNASKHAIEGMVDSLRRELMFSSNIKVSLLQPGQFKSDIWSKTEEDANKNLENYPKNEFEKNYGLITKKVLAASKDAKKNGDDPIIVAKIVEKIILSKNPRARYKMGKNTIPTIILGKLLPDRIVDFLIKKAIK